MFTACGRKHRQHRRCFLPQAVNTFLCSWGWAKFSPESCWAD